VGDAPRMGYGVEMYDISDYRIICCVKKKMTLCHCSAATEVKLKTEEKLLNSLNFKGNKVQKEYNFSQL